MYKGCALKRGETFEAIVTFGILLERQERMSMVLLKIRWRRDTDFRRARPHHFVVTLFYCNNYSITYFVFYYTLFSFFLTETMHCDTIHTARRRGSSVHAKFIYHLKTIDGSARGVLDGRSRACHGENALYGRKTEARRKFQNFFFLISSAAVIIIFVIRLR